MKHLITLAFILLSVGVSGQSRAVSLDPQETFIRRTGAAISLDGTYVDGFSVPVPTANLLGYWSSSYGIEADSTIILVDSLNVPVDTIDLPGLDWDITAGYIPLKTVATLDRVGTPTVDTAFWNHQVPPCVVFQNVDYDSTTYFKIAGHVLNTDSTELHPVRITEIAI